MAICITFGTHVPRLALSELGAEYLRDRNQPIIPLATHKYKKLISGSIRPDITHRTRGLQLNHMGTLGPNGVHPSLLRWLMGLRSHPRGRQVLSTSEAH
ncbi:hypothetical protein N7470_008153 [Penicillium chermesinum]|nr:hypothetical protein N7470_008153 [Penicillium chermesinum]